MTWEYTNWYPTELAAACSPAMASLAVCVFTAKIAMCWWAVPNLALK